MYEEDKKLAKQLIGGNERAFDAFFNEYYARVFRFCLRRVHEDDAEDIAIETMRHAIKRIETYRGEASLITWIYQVTRSQVSAHYKRQKNDPFKFLTVLDASGDPVEGPDGLNSYRFEKRPDARSKHSLFAKSKTYIGGT